MAKPPEKKDTASPLGTALTIEYRPLASLHPYPQNPRRNVEDAVAGVVASLTAYGWRQPIVVDRDMVIVVGHVRYYAALDLGLELVPVHIAADLSPEQCRAYRLADNRHHETAVWDEGKLGMELGALRAEDFPLELTGFGDEEIDRLLASDDETLHPVTVAPLPVMAWVLIGIPTVQFPQIADLVERAKAVPSAIVEVTANSPEERR